MKCVVLFGGKGTRLKSRHRSNKCLITINKKPICFYVINNLLKSFKKEDLVIVTNTNQIEKIKKILKKHFNFEFKIIGQKSPEGISHAAYLAVRNEQKGFYLCLGDFYSIEIHKIIKKSKSSRFIILNKVNNPENYGVFDFKTSKVIEKPKEFVSKYAVRGFYKFDKTFCSKFKNTKKSKRNEFEIIDIINQYNNMSNFKIKKVIDLGSIEGLSNFQKYLKIS